MDLQAEINYLKGEITLLRNQIVPNISEALTISLRNEIIAKENRITSLNNRIAAAAQQHDYMDPSKFLWKEKNIEREPDELFPQNHLFGKYVLKRDRVVKNIKEKLAGQLKFYPSDSRSIYLAGCRGSGKTCLQMLLARSLKAEGYDVYFFKNALDIPIWLSFGFEKLLEDRTKKVAVLIDEVFSNPNSALFTTLLKGNYPHLVTIGTAAPNYIADWLTVVSFRSKLMMTDLVLKQEDEDFQGLVQYCVGLKSTTPELTQAICKFILKECGGHTFPTLAFIEHFFTRNEMKEFLANEEVFYHYFYGPAFTRSKFYLSVRDSCFPQLLDSETAKVAFRLMGGKDEARDFSTLNHFGWWNPEARDFISRFLVNACLSGIQSGIDNALYLDAKKSQEENIEIVIIGGLSCMDDSDFKCYRHESGVEVEENGVIFNWAHKARMKIPNAYLFFQERAVSGMEAFYLNSFADTAIQVVLNATQTADPKSKRQYRDIDNHSEIFRHGKYVGKRYVLFNFAMNGDKIVLPRDTSAHDKVYTFVRSTNTLYCGKNSIKQPAIPNLSGGSRSFSTALTAGCSRNTKPPAFSMLRLFLTCARRW